MCKPGTNNRACKPTTNACQGLPETAAGRGARHCSGSDSFVVQFRLFRFVSSDSFLQVPFYRAGNPTAYGCSDSFVVHIRLCRFVSSDAFLQIRFFKPHCLNLISCHYNCQIPLLFSFVCSDLFLHIRFLQILFYFLPL
jgi:hypothetical protein